MPKRQSKFITRKKSLKGIRNQPSKRAGRGASRMRGDGYRRPL